MEARTVNNLPPAGAHDDAVRRGALAPARAPIICPQRRGSPLQFPLLAETERREIATVNPCPRQTLWPTPFPQQPNSYWGVIPKKRLGHPKPGDLGHDQPMVCAEARCARFA